MLKFDQSKLSFLDCTLRDGGYYTNWDFSENLVDEYFKTVNRLPLEFIEIGYRSKFKEEYAGAFYYLPEFILKAIKAKTNKKLAIILNEKEVRPDDLEFLLSPCKGLVSMVRLAVDPGNFNRALLLAEEVKEMGFLVSFNLMYASKWTTNFELNERLTALNTVADYFYIVDSYGGLYPEEVGAIIESLKKYLKVPLGFHGHNNLEMALINSLTAINAGVEIIDSTVLGMGRGAGNLKTELFLTVLNQQNGLVVDFDALNNLTNSFAPLQEKFRWGTNLPYMVSGAFSMTQNSVVSRIKKRFYSLNSIVGEISVGKTYKRIKPLLREFSGSEIVKKVLVVGGGVSPIEYSSALIEFLKKNPEVSIIFSSSKNVPVFSILPNKQIHCLAGNEGKRLEKMLLGQRGDFQKHSIVVPPKNISEHNYIPTGFSDQIFALNEFKYINICQASATAFAMEIAMRFSSSNIYLTGYDGYEGAVTREQLELFEENSTIFDYMKEKLRLVSLTSTQYSVPVKSIFSQV